MKPKTTLMLVVFLLGGLWEREAQAFYNPSAGRWLSRDPINELGHRKLEGGSRIRLNLREELNLDRFAYNDGVNKIDPKGKAVWWDCVLCAGAIGAKWQGTVAGCAFGCLEVSSESYPFGQCLGECLSTSFSPCELWKSFKGNPAEWVGAAACIACGVHVIAEAVKGPPPGCGKCPISPDLKSHRDAVKECMEEIRWLDQALTETTGRSLTHEEIQDLISACLAKKGIVYPWPPGDG